MANGAYGRGMSLPRRPMEHSTTVLCGDLRATFGADLVCAAMQQGKTMYPPPLYKLRPCPSYSRPVVPQENSDTTGEEHT